MKIMILGAGQVGGSLAEHLAREKNDITIVDNSMERLRELRDRLDVRVVHGHAANPDVLQSADIDDTDMLVAVTSNDEINMICLLYTSPSPRDA